MAKKIKLRVGAYHGLSLVSKLIQWHTDSNISHVSLITPADTEIEAWKKGVTEGRIGANHTPTTQIDIYKIDVTKDQAEAILAFARCQIGSKYDYSGVFRFIPRTLTQSPNRWFCSELVFHAFLAGGVHLLERIESWRVTPAMITYSPAITLEMVLVI